MIHYKIWKDEDPDTIEGESETFAYTTTTTDGMDRSGLIVQFRESTNAIEEFDACLDLCAQLSVLTRDMMRKLIEIHPKLPEKALEEMIQIKISLLEKYQNTKEKDV